MVKEVPYHVGEAHQKEVKRNIIVCTVDYLNKRGEVAKKDVPACKRTGKPTAKTYQNMKANSVSAARAIQGSSAKTKELNKKYQSVRDKFMSSMGYQTSAEKGKKSSRKTRKPVVGLALCCPDWQAGPMPRFLVQTVSSMS